MTQQTHVDVTVLQRERDALRAVVDGLTDPHITMAPVRDDSGKIVDFVYVDANPAALRYLGDLSREQFCGMRLREMYPSDAAQLLLEQYAGAVDSGVPLMLDDYAYPNELFGGQERRYDLRGTVVVGMLSLTWRDVTERHRLLRRLADSESRYRMLAENAADLVIRIDADSRIDWVSPSVRDVLGYEPEALVGSSRWDLLHPDDRRTIEDSMARLRSGRASRQPGDQATEARLRHRNGSYFWFSTTARPAGVDPARAPVVLGLRLIDNEVRARREAEDQRTRREAVLETMTDPHVLMSAVRDQDGRVVDFVYADANRAALEYLSLPPERLVGARLLSLFPAHAGTSLLAAYLHTAESGEPLALDDVEVPNDVLGRPRRYDVRAVKIGDALSLTWRDVTQRHDDAIRLATSEERYRLLAEHSGDVVWQVCPDATILWASPSTGSTLGQSRELLLGTAAPDLAHPDDRERLLDALDRVSTGGGRATSLSIRVRRGDGSHIWMEVAAERVADADRGPGFLVLRLRDVDTEHAATEALTAEREQFRSAMEAASIGMCLVAPDGRFVRVNAALCDLLGRDAQMLATCTWQELTHPDDLDIDLGLFADVLKGWRQRYRLRKRYLRPDGSIVWGDLSVSCVRERSGQVRHLVFQIVDVTTEQQQERALRAAREQYRLLAENATDIVLRTDAAGVITYCSQGVTRVLGWTPEQVLGHRDLDFVHPDDHQPQAVGLPEPALTPPGEQDLQGTRRIRVRCTTGAYRWIGASSRTIRDDDGHPVGRAVGWRDVDAEVRAQQELQRQATTDTLTGLLNRAEIVARLNAILAHPPRTGSRVAVAFADLDHLKEVNDKYGHVAGDTLLKHAADQIRSRVRDGDLVARIGGDELLVVLHGVRGMQDAAAVADKIREALARPHTTAEGSVLTSTASIGLTLAVPGEAVDHLINRADHAMYEAKRHGGNSVVTSAETAAPHV